MTAACGHVGDSKQVEFRVEYQGYELGRDLRVDAHQRRQSTVDGRITGHGDFLGHNSRRLHIECACRATPTAGGHRRPLAGRVHQWHCERAYGRWIVKTNSLNGTIDCHTNDAASRREP